MIASSSGYSPSGGGEVSGLERSGSEPGDRPLLRRRGCRFCDPTVPVPLVVVVFKRGDTPSSSAVGERFRLVPLRVAALVDRVFLGVLFDFRVLGGVSIDEDCARSLTNFGEHWRVSDPVALGDDGKCTSAAIDSSKFSCSGCLRSLMARSTPLFTGCGTTIGFIWWSVYNSNGTVGLLNSEPAALMGC